MVRIKMSGANPQNGDYGDATGENRYSGMIQEDHNAPANLPQDPVMKYYPASMYRMDFYYDGTQEGIDDYARINAKKINRSMREDT